MDTVVEEKNELKDMQGNFAAALLRNNKQIRQDRALAIIEDAEIIYRRDIEDIQQKLKKMSRDRDNMLDLSPTTTDSLKLASDFDAKEFAAKDQRLSIDIRQTEIALTIAKERFKTLFGKDI